MANRLNGWWYAPDAYLTQEHRRDNARLVKAYFTALGWSVNAICALLGNMDVESTINPGLIQGRKTELDPAEDGYGLTQWTPASKLINWAERESYTWRNDGNTQCKRIEYEWQNELQWEQNIAMSFAEFATSAEDIAYLTRVFCRNYERPGDPNMPERVARAQKWYRLLYGLPVWLLFQFRKNRRC